MRLLILRAIPKLPKRANEMAPLNTNDDTKVLVDGSALEALFDIVDRVSKYECQLIEEGQQQQQRRPIVLEEHEFLKCLRIQNIFLVRGEFV